MTGVQVHVLSQSCAAEMTPFSGVILSFKCRRYSRMRTGPLQYTGQTHDDMQWTKMKTDWFRLETRPHIFNVECS